MKRRAELDQILRIAPVALSNLALTYNPDTGTLDTNANLGNLVDHELASDPGRFLCALFSPNDNSGKICDLIEGLVPTPGQTAALRRLGSAAKVAPTSTRSEFDLSLNGLVEVR